MPAQKFDLLQKRNGAPFPLAISVYARRAVTVFLANRPKYPFSNLSFRLEMFRLSEKAVWNVSGRDDAKFQVNLFDLSAFRRVVGQFIGFSFQKVKKEEKLSFRVFAHRDRTRTEQFGFTVSTYFLPLEIAPYSQTGALSRVLAKYRRNGWWKARIEPLPEKSGWVEPGIEREKSQG